MSYAQHLREAHQERQARFYRVQQPEEKPRVVARVTDRPRAIIREIERRAVPVSRDWLIIEQARMPEACSARLTIERIVSEVSASTGVPVRDITSDRRNLHIVAARHEVFWRLHAETDWSVAEIGRRLGRDHTTILHGIRQHEKRRAEG